MSLEGDWRPTAEPLQHSAAYDDLEAELRDLCVALFGLVATETADANVLGAAHLGSLDLVRRSINADGLVLLRGDREEPATRYLYRAWQGEDSQKRGLHFLRTYLQLLLPNVWEVRQLWHDLNKPYGTGFTAPALPRFHVYEFLGRHGLQVDGHWKLGAVAYAPGERPPQAPFDEGSKWLTSRIDILVDLDILFTNRFVEEGRSHLASLLEIIRAVIPARLFPMFRFLLGAVLPIPVTPTRSLALDKRNRLRYPWCGRVVSEQGDARWALGRDAGLVRLPQDFGTFRLGEWRPGLSRWHLRACRAEGHQTLHLHPAASVYGLPRVGETWRRLDGSWCLAQHQTEVLSHTDLAKRIDLPQPVTLTAVPHVRNRLRYPWCGRVVSEQGDARWALGRDAGLVRLPQDFGTFRLGEWRPGLSRWHLRACRAEGHQTLHLHPAASVYGLPRVGETWRRLDGSWCLAQHQTEVLSHATLDQRVGLPVTGSRASTVHHDRYRMVYPVAPPKLGLPRRLDGRWRLRTGTPLYPSRSRLKLNGWPLGRSPWIKTEVTLLVQRTAAPPG